MRYTPSGMAVTNFRIAVDRRRAAADGQDNTDFLDIVAFGKSAEFVAQYLDKGAMVGVEGRIQSRSWEAQDGQRRRSVEIVANTVQALESRQESERRRASRGQSAPAPSGGGPGVPGPSEGAAYGDSGFPVDDPFGED
jgi:single-strand DNA-binding protein